MADATTRTETAEDARARRMKDAHAHMTQRFLEDRVVAFHPHGFDSDEAMTTMLADYDRLVAEQAPPPPPEGGATR